MQKEMMGRTGETKLTATPNHLPVKLHAPLNHQASPQVIDMESTFASIVTAPLLAL